MENNSRKASDILLSIESKIDALIKLYKNQDLNIKVLSNKLNAMIDNSTNVSLKGAPSPSVSVADSVVKTKNTESFVKSVQPLPVESSPEGFRRTSRPETYENQLNDKPLDFISHDTNHPIVETKRQGMSTVQQKVVDKNSKAIFLAEVEVINSSDNSLSFKTKTNGAGKWMAQLSPGEYKVFIRKRESVTKEKMEVVQTLSIDGSEALVNLDMLIVR